MILPAAFILFVDALVYAADYWYWFLLPLSFIIAMVYKAVRLDDLTHLMRQTLLAAIKLAIAFVACAVLLWLIVFLVER
jgi:hypothetical protein